MSRTFASPKKADHRGARPPRLFSATKAPSSVAAVREILTGDRVQTKLRIGARNDRYEREADRVADQLLRMPARVTEEGAPPHVQRMCAECEEDQLQRQAEEDDEELVQAQGFGGGGHRTTLETENEIRSLRSGRPLASAERGFFESRLGVDFGGVRIHTGPRAERLASRVNARAFTFGHNVVFGGGQFSPGSTMGRRLLAHELVHTVQQKASPGRVRADASGVGAGATLIQRSAKETKKLCPLYWRYDSKKKLKDYNCAGLSHRTYSYIGAKALLKKLKGKQGSKCKPGQVKHWLWTYDFHLEDNKGKTTQKAISSFHTVAGVVGLKGNDPTDVYSKNGKRPVEGPGTGPSFKPKDKEHATKNTPKAELIYDAKKKPVYKIRSEFGQWTFCLPCPKT